MSKHIELAKKLKALADQGVGGEKINAETMLNALLKKYKITLEEIEGESIKKYFFNLNPEEYRFFHQIVKNVNFSIKVYGPIPKKKIKTLQIEGNLFIESTASDYIEIETKFEFYKGLYEEELEIFYNAFLTANKLLALDPDKTRTTADLSPEEWQEYQRIQNMANKIKVGQFRKQLDEKNYR